MEIRTARHIDFPGLGLGNLAHISDPPPTLWVRGAAAAPATKYLTVVGSRNLSPYGREACEYLIRGLAGYPISIVSGLALGADVCAHNAALAVGLHTIAIPGSGLADDYIAPRTNLDTAYEILDQGGLLLSEHPPNTTAHPRFFPSRNRIMVGIADAVLMIEAGEKSGTLITARLSGEYGRNLLCIPHRIGDPHGTGNHTFLRIGATLVTEPGHILEVLGIPERTPGTQPPLPALSTEEAAVYTILAKPCASDVLIQETNLPIGTTLAALQNLELNGLVTEQFGLWRRATNHTIPVPKLDHI